MRGQRAGGPEQKLVGDVELLASVFSPYGDYAELITKFGTCTTITTPMRIGSVWSPDLSGRVVAGNGCVEGSTDPNTGWLRVFFDHDFTIKAIDAKTQRLSSLDGSFIDFTWK